MGAGVEPYDVAEVNQKAQQLRSQASGYAFSYIKNGLHRTRLGQDIKNWADRLTEQFNNQALSKQEVLRLFDQERQNLMEQNQLLGIYGVDTIADAMERLSQHSGYDSAHSLISVAGAMPNGDPLKELWLTQPIWENSMNGQKFKLFRYVAQEQIELRLQGVGNSELSLEERARIRQDITDRKIIASSEPVMTPVKEEPKLQLSLKERVHRQRLENWKGVYGDKSQSVPNTVIRQDNDFSSTVNAKGHKKSHIDKEGNLVPADPNGDITIQQHIRGAEPKKSESQFTSTTVVDGEVALVCKDYGSQVIEIDTQCLQQDISSGKVTGVEIVTPQRIQAELKEKVDEAQKLFDEKPSKRNTERLVRAEQDLENAVRDSECLIKGCVSSKYIKKRDI